MPDERLVAAPAGPASEQSFADRASTPPASAAPELTGQVLDARYRLDSVVRPGRVTMWKGTDLVLERSVAVRALVHDEALAHEPQQLLAAARHAGRLVHVGAASTYDATITAVGPVALTYIVTEWVSGTSLDEMLEPGPLAPERAVAIIHRLAQVLAVAHQRRVAHGDLHPADVVITSHGQVKLLDLEVRTALDPDQQPFEQRSRHDLVAVAAMLYAALTARWPGPGRSALAPAPQDDAGRPVTARQLRAGVPRDLDALAMGVLAPDPNELPGSTGTAPTSMHEFAERLERSPVRTGPRDAETPPAAVRAPAPLVRRAHSSRRRRLWLAAPALGLLLAGALLLGLTLGRLPGASQAFPSAGDTHSPAPLGAPLPITAVRSFDPEGDGVEQPGRVPLAYDGDTGTAWSTDTYATADFGRLKSGVGLVVDLGRPERVRQVRLVLGSPGAAVQVRAADTDAPGLAGYPVLAAADPAGTDVRLRPSDARPHRFWLVWFTRLPGTPAGFRADLDEVALLP